MSETKTNANKEKRPYLTLFLTFLKIGAFTFGGGYAMIPVITREIVEKRHWLSNEDILDIIAIAESTPGPIAINSATFVGYKVAGFWGSVLCTAGVVLPSFLIIFVLSGILTLVYDMRVIRYAFFGIRAGVLALLFKALWSMYKSCKKSLFAYLIMAACFLATAFLDISILYCIIACGLLGFLNSLILRKKAEK